MAKHTLEVEFEYDFDLIAISCHLSDYRVCWLINKMLDLSLHRVEHDKDSFHKDFVVFSDKCADSRTEIHLMVNQGHESWLIPEKKQANYLLILNDNARWSVPKLIKDLRDQPGVLTAFEIDPNELKSKDNLILNDFT